MTACFPGTLGAGEEERSSDLRASVAQIRVKREITKTSAAKSPIMLDPSVTRPAAPAASARGTAGAAVETSYRGVFRNKREATRWLSHCSCLGLCDSFRRYAE